MRAGVEVETNAFVTDDANRKTARESFMVIVVVGMERGFALLKGMDGKRS